ncbi:leukocyte receptor cluster member 1 homolog isoform X1 [Centruroides vittatus]|uniref:leukocyte receptor cluster member 1 homolog isoform X1 n=1 Tax=Centruroides vittatus TaxID=120091 RepID=UPI00350ED7E2
MNILPKKRWHVRTKDNIARVRRDEAKAAEEEKELQRRIKLAEQEHRISYLRAKKRKPDDSQEPESPPKSDSKEHINFFSELEKSGGYFGGSNREHDEEKKQEQEKFEKKIGLLTYLGQDISNEVPWYVKIPGERVQDESYSDHSASETKCKLQDPLIDIRHYLRKKAGKTSTVNKTSTEIKESSSDFQVLKKTKYEKEKSSSTKKKSKKNKHHTHSKHKHKKEKKLEKYEKKKTIEELRAERLKREKIERERAEELIKKHRGIKEKQISTDERDRQYNSQFNPHLARQSNVT